MTKASVNRSAGPIDFSLLTDGLRAEREQGITIDVAYRYFATARRKFIIADTPGHEQYTRNMATGASTADLAIILIDARNGVLPQSRRHAYIASLLGIPNFVVAVNKMDLVGYDEDVFRAIEAEFREFLGRLSAPRRLLPADQRAGRGQRRVAAASDALVSRSQPAGISGNGSGPASHPLQRVPLSRAARHSSGPGFPRIRRSDRIRDHPSRRRGRGVSFRRRSRVKSIETFDGALDESVAPHVGHAGPRR